MDISDYFEIDKCITWIDSNKYEKVALQFPEILLHYVSRVIKELQINLPTVYFVVLSDAKYGSCCVDEIACEHAQVEAVIHFGHSCLSQVSRPNLNVKYVFGKEAFDVGAFELFLKNQASENILLFVDVVYHYAIDEIKSCVSKFASNISSPDLIMPNMPSSNNTSIDSKVSCCQSNDSLNIDTALSKTCCCGNPNKSFATEPNSETNKPNDCLNVLHNYEKNGPEQDNVFVKFGRRYTLKSGLKLSDYVLLYIGNESLFLTSLIMTMAQCNVLIFNPVNGQLLNKASDVNKLLMKRYYMMEKARNASFIGILIGTLNVSYYRDMVDKLKKVIKRAGKKCRIYAPGTPNVAKLANVPEFDIFVAVACPENCLIDSSDYLQGIVTPFEMIMACRSDMQWTGRYEVDFRTLCLMEDEIIEQIDNASSTDVSLISGRMINLSGNSTDSQSNAGVSSGTLVQQNQALVLQESYLSNRSFQGLDPQLGETAVEKSIRGTMGVATGYTHEPKYTG